MGPDAPTNGTMDYVIADNTIIEEGLFISTTDCEVLDIENIPIIISKAQPISTCDDNIVGNNVEPNKVLVEPPSKDVLKECLHWPLTPQRKGKRQTDHDPDEIKKQKEDEKEIRKQKRIENKLLKESAKKNKEKR
ncbi:hypothetical protein FQR65_LT13837 [Abscondita terminalis]|nr:hypothetical protein FQR65_LT13837 [Abscondita terminalis]